MFSVRKFFFGFSVLVLLLLSISLFAQQGKGRKVPVPQAQVVQQVGKSPSVTTQKPAVPPLYRFRQFIGRTFGGSKSSPGITTNSSPQISKAVTSKPFIPPWEETNAGTDPNAIRKQLYPKNILSAELHSSEELERDARNYLNQHAEILESLSTPDLERIIAKCVPGKRLLNMCYVVFQQTSGGLEVVGSEVGFTLQTINGRSKMVSLRILLFPEAKKISYKPSLSEQQILQVARGALLAKKLISSGDPLRVEKYKIRYVHGTWRLVAEVKPPNFYRAYVDAHSGEVWLGDDRVSVSGHVSGRGILFDYTDNVDLDNLDLAHLRVVSGRGEETYTDSTGEFSFPVEAPGSLTARLTGQWADVIDQSRPVVGDLVLTEDFLLPDDLLSLVFNPDGNLEEETARVNAYYHTTFIHDWLRARGIGEEIDRSLPIDVNSLDRVCNAFYFPDRVSTMFVHSGTWPPDIICANSAMDTIIYHEYGHFVDDMIGGITDRGWGISEGWGDLIAAFATRQPLGAIGFASDQPYSRSADNGYCFNRFDEIHTQGQAWSGFGWHLRENLIESLGSEDGIALAEELVIPVLYANPSSPNQGVLGVLLRDDNDGDLANGTPHQAEILSAARRHCIDDHEPPAAVTDLTVSDVTQTSVRLTWTATGDDGMEGTATSYEIRRSIRPITEANFTAGEYLDQPTPLLAGTPQTTVGGDCINPGTTYYFAMKVYDEVPNLSPLSNVVSGTTLPDEDPPVIPPESISVPFIGESWAGISWHQFDLPSHSGGAAVDFGLTVTYGRTASSWRDRRVCAADWSQMANPRDLTPGTTYHFRVRAWDGSGNEAVSEDHTFTTWAPLPPPPGCGNGVIEPGESCDDGNILPGDGCSETCRNEPPPPVLAIVDTIVNESAGNATMTVTMTGSSIFPVSVNFSTFSGTAEAGVDFQTVKGTLAWAPGETGDKTFTIPIIDDSLTELDETVTVILSGPTHAIIGRGTAQLIIRDNDPIRVPPVRWPFWPFRF